jgi:hypothetical protein
MPAWLEFDSSDLLPADAAALVLGSSEYSSGPDFVAGYKQAAPVAYAPGGADPRAACTGGAGAPTCTYRLETNAELYEGLRYGFLTLAQPPSRAFTVSALRAVSQAKPVNYVGRFSAAGDPLLERIWYTGAYTVRATLQSGYMGSILEDRGDRISWTGDAHPTQLTSMIAFANYDFVLDNLNRTSCADCCNGIATYCLYFVLSAVDYFRETGDAAALAYFVPVITAKLEAAYALYPNPHALRFVGHDDRLGNGFCNSTTPETQMVYRFLAIRCWAEFSDALGAAGLNASLAAHFAGYAAAAAQTLRAGGARWWEPLFVHSAGDAVNAGFATPAEQAAIADAFFGDSVVLPSHSNFQQFFLLQAQARLGQLDRAVETARLVWGSEIALSATTFFEISNPDMAQILAPGPSAVPNEAGWCSLAHPWSSGVTPWLTKNVLGVSPLTPGYTTALVAPHVAHSMAGVAGRVPTPHGPISLNASRATAEASIELVLPAGVREATVRLSSVLLARLGVGDVAHGASAADLAGIVIEEAAGAPLAMRVVASPHAPLIDEADASKGRALSLELELRGGRAYSLRVRAVAAVPTGAPPRSTAPWAPLASPFPPPSWPGRLVGSDAATQGDWIGRFGADGYALFGLGNSSGGEFALMKLPPYVASLQYFPANFNDKVFEWPAADTATDPRALQMPGGGGGGGARRLGSLSPIGSGSAMADCFVSNDAPAFRLSQYFCDFGPTPWGDGQEPGDGRTQEVYLLTGYPQLNPLAPRLALSGFGAHNSSCLWLTYELPAGQSFRVRSTTIRGDYSVLSALAFDPAPAA